ncbi:MAG: primosomal protein N' [Erysipelotrichaceae bacterium]|nr:primosomal protein N' [Erysipelotrichaceae bacterium]
MFVVEVYVTNSSLYTNQLFSYYSDFYVEPFKRVDVIFNNAKNTALTVNCFEIEDLLSFEEEKGFKLNKIIDVYDELPIISKEQFELAKWLSKVTVSPFVSCLNTMLPKALKTSKNIIKPKMEDYLLKIKDDYPFTKRQKEVYDSLTDNMLIRDARLLSSSIIKKFIDEGVIEVKSRECTYSSNNQLINDNFKELTSDQYDVYQKILNTDKIVSLLFGVTGSGKTEVYLHLAREYLKEGKEVLILVPEISLTPQMINRVKERFNDVIFYHSELSDQERYEQYKRVINGEVKIVVGTRSSIFLPFNNLGLIIIDEEHDSSYKQDNTPTYLAKNVAIKRALTFNGKVLLASATPSLDSYTRAIKGEYELLRLNQRINNTPPQIEIVDLTKEVKNKSSYIISRKLKEEIANTLERKKQVIILLNRRGYSPVIKCGDCGTTLMCTDCDMPLNYHKNINLLKCHQCGKTYSIPRYCPKCNSKELLYYGFGTLKVEEELKHLFPNASIDRMDRDNVSKKGAHEKILKRFENKEIDILIGTQMIAKGLDYPDVTLVGILNADAGLAHQDYNAAKTTLDLLMQASGRSGRANEKGNVIIQAFNPDHYVLKAVYNQDFDYFYKIEMNYRSKTMYPPYSHLMEITIMDTNMDHIKNSLDFLEKRVKELPFKSYRPVELPRIKNNYRYRILIANKDMKSLIDEVWKLLDEYLRSRKLAKIKVDIDPLYLE